MGDWEIGKCDCDTKKRTDTRPILNKKIDDQIGCPPSGRTMDCSCSSPSPTLPKLPTYLNVNSQGIINKIVLDNRNGRFKYSQIINNTEGNQIVGLYILNDKVGQILLSNSPVSTITLENNDNTLTLNNIGSDSPLLEGKYYTIETLITPSPSPSPSTRPSPTTDVSQPTLSNATFVGTWIQGYKKYILHDDYKIEYIFKPSAKAYVSYGSYKLNSTETGQFLFTGGVASNQSGYFKLTDLNTIYVSGSIANGPFTRE